MKKAIRKMNIGVLLAAILFIATVIFVIVTNIAFESKKSDIENFVGDFMNETCKSNVGSADEVYENQREIAAEYFSDYEINEDAYNDCYYAGNYMEKFDEARQACLYYTQKGDLPGKITSSEVAIRSIHINKIGMNCAKVTVNAVFSADVKGSALVCSTCGIPDFVLCDQASEYKDPVYKINKSVELVFFLSPSGDSWKIDYINDVQNNVDYSYELVSGERAEIRKKGESAPDESEVQSNE